jgi:hypothetical protein
MKSAPSVLLEAMVKKEAAQTAFRMLEDYKPNTRDMQGHLKIYLNFRELMDLHQISDTMPIKYDWKVLPSEPGALEFYTDGSRKNGSAGIGIYGPSVRHHDARLCLNRVDIEGHHVYIMSDSQAALKAMRAHSIDSKLTAECLDTLKDLSTNSNVTLTWVPSHTEVEGNEIADQLFNKSAESCFIGPSPFSGTIMSNINEH